MGKDGTQLLRHCLRLLVRVSTDLGAVRLSGSYFINCVQIYFNLFLQMCEFMSSVFYYFA